MTTPFVIRTRPGAFELVLDGEPVTAQAFRLEQAPDQLATLTLFAPQAAPGIVEGLAVVQVADDRLDADIICEFLAGIDPGQLEHDALAAHDAGNSLTGPMLRVLAKYARGEGL